MQQVIYLEPMDLAVMKLGQTLQLQVPGATIMLGYLGRTYKTSNGKHSVGKVEGKHEPTHKRRTAWNKGKTMHGNRKPPKKPCKICHRRISPLGMAPHMGKHRRDGDILGKVVA